MAQNRSEDDEEEGSESSSSREDEDGVMMVGSQTTLKEVLQWVQEAAVVLGPLSKKETLRGNGGGSGTSGTNKKQQQQQRLRLSQRSSQRGWVWFERRCGMSFLNEDTLRKHQVLLLVVKYQPQKK